MRHIILTNIALLLGVICSETISNWFMFLPLCIIGSMVLCQYSKHPYLRLIKRIYYVRILMPDLIDKLDGGSSLFDYPFLLWLNLEGKQIFIQNTYRDFSKIAIDKYSEIANSFIDKLKKFKFKKDTPTKMALRRLFEKSSNDREEFRQLEYIRKIEAGETNVIY